MTISKLSTHTSSVHTAVETASGLLKTTAETVATVAWWALRNPAKTAALMVAGFSSTVEGCVPSDACENNLRASQVKCAEAVEATLMAQNPNLRSCLDEAREKCEQIGPAYFSPASHCWNHYVWQICLPGPCFQE